LIFFVASFASVVDFSLRVKDLAASKKSSLAQWMRQVLKEADKAAQHLAADPVHDLRVALRRCRSMAEGMQAIDPDSSWKKMRKAGKDIFSRLGDLRDCHVMVEWTARIGGPDDPVTQALLSYFQQQQHNFKQEVEQAFRKFDRKQWERWAHYLPRRAARIPLNSEPFQCLALERWTQARKFQRSALKTGNPPAFHRLRIALKKFRYLVENFLPDHHKDWVDSLKEMQDILGEIHDLDLLWETVIRIQVLNEPDSYQRWEQRIQSERQVRIEAYREKMSGQNSLWAAWRSGLPRGEQAGHAVFKKLETWASFLDSDSGHSRRITRFALQLHDGLLRAGLLAEENGRAREVLRAAAILHDVGYSNGNKNHHKATRRLIRKLDVPFAWKHQDLEMAALVAGYHRGALPRSHQKKLLAVPQTSRLTTKRLAGVLRLANAFDLDHDGAIKRIKVTKVGDHVVIYAAGLNPASKLAEKIAGARYLLEMSFRAPVLVRPMPPAQRRISAKTSNQELRGKPPTVKLFSSRTKRGSGRNQVRTVHRTPV
jgi:CHAD domain-containing protein